MNGEAVLLARWQSEDDPAALRSLLQRYLKSSYALILNLTGCDRNTAYEFTASILAKSIESLNSSSHAFFLPALQLLVDECSRISPAAFFDSSQFLSLPPEKRESAKVLKEALFALPYGSRTMILLRDQLNLSYKEISDVLAITEREARSTTFRIRGELRDKIEEALNRHRGKP